MQAGPSFDATRLAQYYSTVRTARDIMVEGESDATFLRDLLRQLGHRKINVYPSRFYDCGTGEIRSARDKVLFATRSIAGSGTTYTNQFVGVLDADFSVGQSNDNPYALMTDPPDLIAYGADEESLTRLLTVILGARSYKASDFLCCFATPLELMYKARLISQRDGLNLKFSCGLPSRAFTYRRKAFTFGTDRYFDALLDRSGLPRSFGEGLRTRVKAVRLPSSQIPIVNGHDLANIVGYFARCIGAGTISDEAVEGMILMSASHSIAKSSMFSELLRRLT